MPTPRPLHAVLAVVALAVAAGSARGGVTFDLDPVPGTSQQALDGFAAAGDRWSSHLEDDVVIRLGVGFTSLGPGILGSTSSPRIFYWYTDVADALLADARSANDALAVSSLPSPPAVDLWLNRTSDSPEGSGSATPYLDDDGGLNNQVIAMTRADAKAMGLLPAADAAPDATIVFSSDFTWDFDPTDGITAGAFDFIGVAAHEIGHALGFISGVDVLDTNSPPGAGPYEEDQFIYVSPVDLFRYSASSYPDRDWTADTRGKYFSIDGGITPLAAFSTGVVFGDGRQASHWKDNLGLGLMDPTAAPGEELSITGLDLLALDVIGWDLALVPEPATLFLFGLGLGVPALAVLRRRSRAARSRGGR